MNKSTIQIIRENSAYGNKKWHVVIINSNNSKSSDWVDTLSDAEYKVKHYNSNIYPFTGNEFEVLPTIRQLIVNK